MPMAAALCAFAVAVTPVPPQHWAHTGRNNATVEAGCTPSATQGCLNGHAYDFTTQFPCGGDIFSWDDHLCCEQGRPFTTADQYCCTGSGQRGVHSYTEGKCDLDCPDECACYDEAADGVDEVADPGSLIDTSSPPEGGYECTDSTTKDGCMNGYTYDYSKFAPCGAYLMQYGKWGCCPLGAPLGLTPYVLGSTFCCKNDTAPAGSDYALSHTACKCHRYGCS